MLGKWPKAVAVLIKTARCVADFIYWTITRNGCAEIQISDQGREFINQVSEELHRRTGMLTLMILAVKVLYSLAFIKKAQYPSLGQFRSNLFSK